MEKIVVINNDVDTMSLLQNWLEKKSYEVKFTSSQAEGLQLVKHFEPGLVLVDVLQKDIIAQLKNGETTQSIPIILMTGYALRHKPPEMPVDDMIEKPFNLNLLEKKIEKLISRQAPDHFISSEDIPHT
jgi:DNA-binding response OmpR family regulator